MTFIEIVLLKAKASKTCSSIVYGDSRNWQSRASNTFDGCYVTVANTNGRTYKETQNSASRLSLPDCAVIYAHLEEIYADLEEAYTMLLMYGH